jgi:hypothetical protein
MAVERSDHACLLAGLVKTLATKRMDLDEEDAEEEDAGEGRV